MRAITVELQEIKDNDKIRLEYIYQCQLIINSIQNNVGTNEVPLILRKTLQHNSVEIQKNLNHRGR